MTNLQEKTVLFDPGYAKHTTILSINVEYMYASIAQYKNFGQKKLKFKMLYPQLLKITESNVGFCLGSLLWAIYIKSLGDVKIEGNPCLGDTYNKEETIEEADYSIEFFDKLKKDAKYYIGENYEINPLHVKILELYKEFLTLNCGFVSTKTTNDLILPDSFSTPSQDVLDQINNKIKEVTQSGKLLELLELFTLVYKG